MARGRLIVPFHSFAGVITNSSSELFALVRGTAVDEAKATLVRALDLEGADEVKVELLDTFELAAAYVANGGLGSYRVRFDALFPGARPFGTDVASNPSPSVGDEWDRWYEEHKAWRKREDVVKGRLLKELQGLEASLEPLRRSAFYVDVWCEEDSDVAAAARAIGAVEWDGH